MPTGETHLLEWLSPGNAGVIDKSVDATKFGQRALHDFVDLVGIRDMAAHGAGADSECLQFFSGLLATLPFARAQDDIGSRLRERLRNLATQTN